MSEVELLDDIKEFIISVIRTDWESVLPCPFKVYILGSYGVTQEEALEVFRWFNDAFRGEPMHETMGLRKKIGFLMPNPFLILNVYLELEYVKNRRVLEIRLRNDIL